MLWFISIFVRHCGCTQPLPATTKDSRNRKKYNILLHSAINKTSSFSSTLQKGETPTTLLQRAWKVHYSALQKLLDYAYTNKGMTQEKIQESKLKLTNRIFVNNVNNFIEYNGVWLNCKRNQIIIFANNN